jgi:Fe-S-cluster-containing dehydrogenase component
MDWIRPRPGCALVAAHRRLVRKDKMTKQLGFYFDASTCTGCKARQIACKDKMNCLWAPFGAASITMLVAVGSLMLGTKT